MQPNNSKFISSHEDLEVYQIAFDAAMEILPTEGKKAVRPCARSTRKGTRTKK